MGAHPYWYVVPYEDPKIALRKLRHREFKAGRYYPAVRRPKFPVNDKSPTPGARHESINDAITASDASGTASILDIAKISPNPEFLCASPLDNDKLIEVLGHATPVREEILDSRGRVLPKVSMFLFQGIGRGEAVFTPLFKDRKPVELLFYGYSVD